MTRKDSRPTLRAVQRERVKISAQIEGKRRERFEMGYLMGMSVALLWMSDSGTAPPTVMFETMQEMLAHERKRRNRKSPRPEDPS